MVKEGSSKVVLINTTNNTAYASVPVGNYPYASGQFISNIRVAPIITWSNPANITYGTPLNSTQLNANASVPGIFVYTPPSGTILNVGLNQTLNTYFTPTDTANYTTASANVSITVMRSPVAYITNNWNNTVSVINTTTNTVTAKVPVGSGPYGATITPDGTKIYITNINGNTVSVINAATNTVTSTIPVGNNPVGVSVTPNGKNV